MFRQVGTLASATGFGGSPVYARDFERGQDGDYTTLFVRRSSGCFTVYGNYDAGG